MKWKERWKKGAGRKKAVERKERRKEDKAESNNHGRRKREGKGNRKKWEAPKN